MARQSRIRVFRREEDRIGLWNLFTANTGEPVYRLFLSGEGEEKKKGNRGNDRGKRGKKFYSRVMPRKY